MKRPGDWRVVRRTMRAFGASLAIGALVACGDSKKPASPEGGGEAVVAEAPPPEFAEVGAIIDVSPGRPRSRICAASLIESDVILTAAHCIVLGQNRPLAFARTTDPTDLARASLTPIVAAYAHPGFVAQLRDTAAPMHDIGIMVLVRDLQGVRVPALTLSAAQLPVAGALWSIAGLAVPAGGGGGDGRGHSATATIADVSATEFTIRPVPEPRPCYGDSGAPAYPIVGGHALGAIVSRASRDSDFSCASGAVFTRVDAHAAWIRSVLQRVHARPLASTIAGWMLGAWGGDP